MINPLQSTALQTLKTLMGINPFVSIPQPPENKKLNKFVRLIMHTATFTIAGTPGTAPELDALRAVVCMTTRVTSGC